MSGNGNAPIPFQTPAGTPLVGQPFTLLTVGVPMNLTLTCNCPRLDDTADRPVLTIVSSAPATCPSCGKTYNALFNPQTMKIAIQVGLPAAKPAPALEMTVLPDEAEQVRS